MNAIINNYDLFAHCNLFMYNSDIKSGRIALVASEIIDDKKHLHVSDYFRMIKAM